MTITDKKRKMISLLMTMDMEIAKMIAMMTKVDKNNQANIKKNKRKSISKKNKENNKKKYRKSTHKDMKEAKEIIMKHP
jgi:hypothetical protein